MTARRWAYAAVAGWATTLVGMLMIAGASLGRAWVLVGGLVSVIVVVVAVVAVGAVWALVGEV